MTTTERKLDLGTGVYSLPRVRRLLSQSDDGLTASRLRNWTRSGIIPEVTDGLVNFHDLISLEVVRRMVETGASFQSVRTAGEHLRETFGIQRPFACDLFYTHRDGGGVTTIWANVNDDLIEIVGHRPNHTVLEAAIRSFAEGISFDEDKRADRWELSEWVVIDPEVQFGEPTIKGTRMSVAAIEANLEEGTAEEVADWYGLQVEQVRDVADYLATAA